MQFGHDENVEKYFKVGGGCGFVVLQSHVRVLTPINDCNSNTNFAQLSIVKF